ncbi:MAG: hypothetical protein LBV27_02575 [Oscillospiraceae bacterium]|jgi:hypothetical protein|nr:hypothetical protein [Oscillospiraceae bacterium]
MKNELNTAYLDTVRTRDGDKACIDALRAAYERGATAAAEAVNDPALSFPSLYILLPHIHGLGLLPLLETRGARAAGIVAQIMEPDAPDYLSRKDADTYAALRWILETGYDADGLDAGYKKTLDITVSVLIDLYGDMNILPLAAHMIFARNKVGQNTHDLIWAFFHSRDAQALHLIAARLASENAEEAKFAGELLGIDRFEGSNDFDGVENFPAWLETNSRRLTFTGESHQYASKPTVFTINNSNFPTDRRRI